MSEEKDKKEEAKPDVPEPRWNIINEIFDGFDKVLGDKQDDEKLTFFEIQASIMMLTEKVNQEKLSLFMQYVKDEHSPKLPDSMYR